ncbi:MAG: hypothetical protein SFY68_03610 [Candidatus Sumerlaeia bacterium]|nr:hypothetical protein [Candidatus Sumerlaeia bacterium]
MNQNHFLLILSVFILVFASPVYPHGENTRGLTNKNLLERVIPTDRNILHPVNEHLFTSDDGTTESVALHLMEVALGKKPENPTWGSWHGLQSVPLFSGDGETPKLNDHTYAHFVLYSEQGDTLANTYEGRIPVMTIIGVGDSTIQTILKNMKRGEKRFFHLPVSPLIQSGWFDPSLAEKPVSPESYIFMEATLLHIKPPIREALNSFTLTE